FLPQEKRPARIRAGDAYAQRERQHRGQQISAGRRRDLELADRERRLGGARRGYDPGRAGPAGRLSTARGVDWVSFVARIERSELRGPPIAAPPGAALHPG